MKQVVIENPVINSPFEEPKRHFRFSNEGITNEIVEGRRTSQYFIPIPRARKRRTSQEELFETQWTEERIQENKFINQVRARVANWRSAHYAGVTKTTQQLLRYWTAPDREKKLFFCQIEALETAIYLTEIAQRAGDTWIDNHVRSVNAEANPELYRVAFKMATGSGKTVVMAMLIAWQALNKLANPQDGRFSDAFLIVTPGIPIRDRLRVLLPNDPGNYYRQRDILPPDRLQELGQAKIVITNFHAFKPRERSTGSKLARKLSGQEQTGVATESAGQMVRRVCRELGNKKNIIVLNDEAHHCYRRKQDGVEEKLKGDERKEAEKREEEARVWISGLEAAKRKLGMRVVYDLSATPFFLRGSGYDESVLFGWVVSDFSLIDAIESGIVKVPRVPVADDSMTGEQPTYRDLWLRIREDLPRKGRGTSAVKGEPRLPAELQGALHSLYGNYEKYYRQWEQNEEARAKGATPPVFIVVCSNTNVSKLVYDYIGGWEKSVGEDRTVVVPGALEVFRNDNGDGNWRPRPNTVLIDSEQLESGEGMTKEFKQIAAAEIEIFKDEYRARYPGRDVEQLTDEDLLREVMNTVGKQGRLGEHVKCVVSVSMLTEGWDANTVTHILGVRAFGTQLLCEQVVGRGLRRMSYAAEPGAVQVNGKAVEFTAFPTEYAEVYGVPFSFIPTSGSQPNPDPGPNPTRVRALEERIDCEITFPRLVGYRFDIRNERLNAAFNEGSRMVLSTMDVPSWTENAPIIGESSIHRLDDLKQKRLQEVAFLLAKLTLEKYFRQDGETREDRPAEHRFDAEVKHWLFPDLLAITRRWLETCVVCKDNTFVQLLLLIENAHDAADCIYRAVVAADRETRRLLPLLRPYDVLGSTRYVDFDTTRPVYETDPTKCHVSHVVADTDSWEQKMAQALEEMDEAVRYVKNHNLGFTIPYTFQGDEHQYVPDFLLHWDDSHDDRLNVIVEVTGERRPDKIAKVSTARDLWVPAVNNHGGFGRWAFVEIGDPWDAKNLLRSTLAKTREGMLR